MLEAETIRAHFERGKPYEAYVASGDERQRKAWAEVYERAALDDEQRALISGFTREIKVLVSSGVWCGDCVQQCPLMERIAEASPLIETRYVDRDEHEDLARRVSVCGGLRVPMAVFAAEDFAFVSLFGDRTLTRYRAMAARNLGAACPVPGAPLDEDELRGTLGDWLGETERVHLLLRLSTRLRQKHGD